jgi:hypothetical protein
METVLEPGIPANDDIHTEGEKLTGFAGLFWATSMERLYQEAYQSLRHAAMAAAARGEIGTTPPLTRKEFIKSASFQTMTGPRALCLLAKVGMPFMFVMQMRTIPAAQVPKDIKLATG